MTDISVIKMIISVLVAIWRTYPSWVNDKLRAWEGLGHSRMFWARRSKLEIISFLSRVMSVSKSFFVFPALLKDLAPNVQALGLLVSTMSWRPFWKLRSVTRHFFGNSDYDHEFFENFLSFFFFFQSRAGVTWLTAMAIPRLNKALWWWYFETRMKTWLPGVGEIVRRRTINRRRDWYESCAVIHSPKDNNNNKKTQGCQRLIVRSLNPSSPTNQRVLRSLFPRPDVATVLHFAVIVYVQLQDGQTAAQGKRRKAVIRDVSGVDHRGVTNLSAPISFTGQGHCTVFRHVMEFSLLVMC